MKITGVNHITLSVNELESCVVFYRDILGCELIATWDSGAYLMAGNTWLCLSKDENAKQTISSEYSHIAFCLENNNFTEIKEYFNKHNVKYWKENTSEGNSLYLLDPSYNKLEIHNSTLNSRIESLKQAPYPGLKLFATDNQ